MKDPVDHVLRPLLPWRPSSQVTECGLNASKSSTLTREQFLARLKDMGIQRTSLLTCMTCYNTANRWGTWNDDPRKALDREIQWETRVRDRGSRLLDELNAIAALIETHRDEFDAMVSETEQRRAWNEKLAARNR